MYVKILIVIKFVFVCVYYFSSNLISTLASLKVANFTHFLENDYLVSQWKCCFGKTKNFGSKTRCGFEFNKYKRVYLHCLEKSKWPAILKLVEYFCYIYLLLFIYIFIIQYKLKYHTQIKSNFYEQI